MPADMEIEAMSLHGGIRRRAGAVIDNSPKSATPQFALDERSLFPAGDSAALAEKIDYWMEHPAERAEMERAYAQSAQKYALDDCVTAAEAMFRKAMEEAHG